MSRHLLLLPALIGCAGPDLAPNDGGSLSEFRADAATAPVTAPLATIDGQAPPPILTLGPSNLVPGQAFTLTVTGAPANATIYLARGSTTGSTCLPQLAGLCLGLSAPAMLGTITASPQGIATWQGAIPATVPVGTTQLFQAVYLGPAGNAMSPVVSATAIAVCGDAIRQSTEACDDGNAQAGDGCEPSCQLTPVNDFRLTILDARIRSTDPQGNYWDDFALLPPFTNPDPFVEVRVNNFVVGRTVTRDDTFRPNWSAAVDVSVNPGESLVMAIIDEEPAGVLNQTIGTVTLTHAALQAARNAGVQTATGRSVTSFRFEITDP